MQVSEMAVKGHGIIVSNKKNAFFAKKKIKMIKYKK